MPDYHYKPLIVWFCADLTNKAGYWAKALAERFCERDTILFYYVTTAGDVHFGINGEEKGVFFSGVETRGPLWAMMDVYGNSTAVELLDAKNQLKLNNSRRCVESGRENYHNYIRETESGKVIFVELSRVGLRLEYRAAETNLQVGFLSFDFGS